MPIVFNSSVAVPELKNRRNLKQFLLEKARMANRPISRLEYNFLTDEALLAMNREFLRHDDYTDILTFDFSTDDELSGAIYISIDRVRENAIQFDEPAERELHRVIFHGLLHLLGWDDKTRAKKQEMRRQEELLLDEYLG